MNSTKLIINAALTGIVPTKKQTPFAPVTPEEIARDAKRAYDLGASIVHIHARDKNGEPSHKKAIYREIILRIREKCDDIIITVSTSGRKTKILDERLEVIDLDGDAKPDMASLTLGSLNFMNDVSITHPQDILFILRKIHAAGLKPELEIFDTGMANYAEYLFRTNRIWGPQYANLILGSLGTMPATPRDLFHLVGSLPDECIWAATGVGNFAFQTQCLSISAGGHVRVGIEDTIFMNSKRELATNEKLIQRIRRVADAVEREVMTATELRTLLFPGSIHPTVA
jgi:3-keto-5-aminohexanoate cleavage enzyme